MHWISPISSYLPSRLGGGLADGIWVPQPQGKVLGLGERRGSFGRVQGTILLPVPFSGCCVVCINSSERDALGSSLGMVCARGECCSLGKAL